MFVIFLSSFFFASKLKQKNKTCHINDTIAADVKIALDSELPRRRCCRPAAQSGSGGGARRLSDRLENTGRERGCRRRRLLLPLCAVLFFEFAAQLFHLSVIPSAPPPSPCWKNIKSCLGCDVPGPRV